MSTFTAPLSEFTLEKHPNADSLSIAKVGEWQCVVRTDELENETLAVYVPLDAIADEDHPLLDFLKGNRVKTCKLRGVLSQGVLLPYSKVENYLKNNLNMKEQSIEKLAVLGKNFAPVLRIKRWYDPTTTLSNGATIIPENPNFKKYTDVEHWKNYSHVLKLGDQVHITEKLHGTSARYGLVNGEFVMGSRQRQLDVNPEGKTTVWNQVAVKNSIKEKLTALCEKLNSTNVSIYGEIVGPKVQDLKYGLDEPDLFVYDISVDNHYLDATKTDALAVELGLRVVPLLKVGALEKEDFDLRLGNTTLGGGTHVREGVVIKPVQPKYDMELGRVILKVISEDYLMRSGAKDVQD